MTKFLESLQKRLAEVDLNSVTKPNDVPIEPNEHAVGEMNDDLKRLLVVRLKAIEAYNNFKGSMQRGDILVYDDRLNQQLTLLGLDAHTIDEIFWGSLITEYPDLANKPRTIFKGWNAIWTDAGNSPLD